MTEVYLDYHGNPIKQGFYEYKNELILITTGGICDTPKETIHNLEARVCCDDLSFVVFHQDYNGAR